MKLHQIIILIFLPISLIAQNGNKFEIADSVINVKELLQEQFGDEIINQVKKMELLGSPYSYGILQLDNLLEKKPTRNNEKIPGGCQCNMIMGKLQISNAVGFMAGIASVIEINISDSTYQSRIHYNTDGARTHKFKQEDEFIKDIVVPLEKSKLEISPDSKFKHNGIIKGKLTGTSIKYLEDKHNGKGFKEIRTNVLSIFECKLEDYEQMMKEYEMGDELEMLKKLKEEENKQKEKKKNWAQQCIYGNTRYALVLRIYGDVTAKQKEKNYSQKVGW